MMNKKGQSEGGGGLVSAKLIIVILVVLVVISMFVIMYRMGILDKIRDVIPGFSVGGGGRDLPTFDAVIAGQNVKIVTDDGTGRCKIVDGEYGITYSGNKYHLEWWNGKGWDNVDDKVASKSDLTRYDGIKNMFLGVGIPYQDIDGKMIGETYPEQGKGLLVIDFKGKKYNTIFTNKGFKVNVQLDADEADPLLETKSLKQLYNERDSSDSPFAIFELKGAEGKQWQWESDDKLKLIDHDSRMFTNSGYLYVEMKESWKGSLELDITDRNHWFYNHLSSKGENLRVTNIHDFGSTINIRLKAEDFLLIDIDKDWKVGNTFRLLSDLERESKRWTIEKADPKIDSDVFVSNIQIPLAGGDSSPKDYYYNNRNLYDSQGDKILKLSNEQKKLKEAFEKVIPPTIDFNGDDIGLSFEEQESFYKDTSGNSRNDLFAVARLSNGEKYAISPVGQINYYHSASGWRTLYKDHVDYADAINRKKILDDLIRECNKKR